MSAVAHAFVGTVIHDGIRLHDAALLVHPNGRAEITPPASLPQDCRTHDLTGGVILPGFVDLQVNGGGGVMFNDHQTPQALDTIARAHAGIGTAGLLPTLITDRPEVTVAAIDAVARAIDEKIPGIAGLHLEGPHLSLARKGAHDPALIRPMEDEDLRLLLDAADRIGNVMVTLAPENVRLEQIKSLARAGIVVSLGHTDADYDSCMAAFDAGARCATHLFNAMSQLGSRQPGLVGAALSHGGVHAGLIADGVHVHPASLRVCLAAKVGPGEMFLVTDAMAPAGTDDDGFTLNGRRVTRRDGRLTLEDGTLAGADLSMPRALSVLIDQVGVPLEQAIARATSIPAGLLRSDMGLGHFRGQIDGMIHLDLPTGQTRRLSDLMVSPTGPVSR
jgi:N-acetylglucosamine-6-phosphate deacetylase